MKVMNHVFISHSIIELYKYRRRKLFCAVIEYSFGTANRSSLWSKLISVGINEKIITAVYNVACIF